MWRSWAERDRWGDPADDAGDGGGCEADVVALAGHADLGEPVFGVLDEELFVAERGGAAEEPDVVGAAEPAGVWGPIT